MCFNNARYVFLQGTTRLSILALISKAHTYTHKKKREKKRKKRMRLMYDWHVSLLTDLGCPFHIAWLSRAVLSFLCSKHPAIPHHLALGPWSQSHSKNKKWIVKHIIIIFLKIKYEWRKLSVCVWGEDWWWPANSGSYLLNNFTKSAKKAWWEPGNGVKSKA